MAQIKEMIAEKTVKKVQKKSLKRKKAIFGNLLRLLNMKPYQSAKILMRGYKVDYIYMEIPFAVALQYDLVSINFSSVHKTADNGDYIRVRTQIGQDELKEINGKYYGWVKPVYSGELYLYVKKKRIPASMIFGDKINYCK